MRPAQLNASSVAQSWRLAVSVKFRIVPAARRPLLAIGVVLIVTRSAFDGPRAAQSRSGEVCG